MNIRPYDAWTINSLLVSLSLVTFGCSKEFSFDKLPEVGGPGAKGTGPNEPPYTGDPGDDSAYLFETFSQASGEAKLDILVIVDNSTSMEAEQKKLGQRLSSFTNSIRNVDWQIGITTTDVSTGRYGLRGELLSFPNGSKVISRATANANDEFLETVVRPETNSGCTTCPSGDEQPLAAMIMSMQKKDDKTKALYRADADLAVIVLSDEDEKSTGGGTQPQEVVDAFRGIFGSEKNLSVYGVVVEPGDKACFDAQNAISDSAYAMSVANLSAMTLGTTSSICDSDYSAGLKKISERVGQMLTSIQLAHEMNPATVEVFFEPVQEIKYRMEGRRILFERAPSANTKIKVKYKKMPSST